MLVFQSKLLLLNSAERHYQLTKAERHLEQAERFRSGLYRAEAALRESELMHTVGAAGYWLSVYQSLIDRATDAVRKLRTMAANLPTAERFEVSTDVQMLDELIAHWTSRVRLIETHGRQRRGAGRRRTGKAS